MGALLRREAKDCRERHAYAREGVTMKADADREKEALQWAVDHFRKDADELKPGHPQGREDAVFGFLLLYDSPIPERRAQAENEIRANLLEAWLGDQGASQHIRDFAAALIERGDSLPGGIFDDFIVEFLRNPEKPNLLKSKLHRGPDRAEAEFYAKLDQIRSINARKPGRSRGDLLPRDVSIWIVMKYIIQTWKFPATRNEATKDKGKHACAASIVREAIKRGAGLHLSEAAIVKVWNKMGLPGEEAISLVNECRKH
jgi:hypothetical protein